MKPVDAKVKAIVDFPIPSSEKELMKFLGMAGYYRKFCPHLTVIAEPLTNLLSKKAKFLWNNKCQMSFDKIKAILLSSPVPTTPNFEKQFKLTVVASDFGGCAVLLQEDMDGIDHPVCYFSRKFNRHQRNYSTIEKECLALILALQHFEIYVDCTCLPVVVLTDHIPLVFLSRMNNTNQRLLRWIYYCKNITW